jgi:hypothetical protein
MKTSKYLFLTLLFGTALALISGGFALVWSFLRTGLILRAVQGS